MFHRFSVEERSVVSHLFHQWAKKKAFQDPKRLLDKVIILLDAHTPNNIFSGPEICHSETFTNLNQEVDNFKFLSTIQITNYSHSSLVLLNLNS